ncbi:MAG TPA: uracil-DNA glycosylase [Gammaproteobacteria bacterium]|nr:uracil-DNA glycosylase [Gammaproteobacteria bacterium]
MDSKRQSRLQDLGITPWVPRKGTKLTQTPRTSAAAASSPAPEPLVIPNGVAGDERAAAIAAMDWDTLKAAVKVCTACGLRAGCTQTVFGVGDERAKWLFIGEAPGADEDRLGEPFVGRAGQLLNSMIAAMGLKREQVYIANILKCRPPNNRDPAPAEAELCRPFLERQIALIQPRLIVALGRIAAQNLLNTETPIGKLRGAVHRLGGTPVVVTYHPAYLLRSPGEKRKAWIDLQLAIRTSAGVRA